MNSPDPPLTPPDDYWDNDDDRKAQEEFDLEVDYQEHMYEKHRAEIMALEKHGVDAHGQTDL